MSTLTSHDGTTIAYERLGQGTPIILVDGAFGSRTFGPNESLAPMLAQHFTVFSYDRRGRGESGDTSPYAVEREIEDIEALIVEAGGAANLYGISSGAALALEAADRLAGVEKLALFEAPFVVDDTRPPVPEEFVGHLRELIAADRRTDAIRYFMTKGVNLPGIFVAVMRIMPSWSKLKAVAHTIPYDATIIGDYWSGRPLPTDRWGSLPARTLVMDGGKSPDWIRNAMRSLSDVLPNAEHQTLDGQMHVVKAKAMAPVLIDFFADQPQRVAPSAVQAARP